MRTKKEEKVVTDEVKSVEIEEMLVQPYKLKYYLDTNAVRSFSPRLKQCREVGAFTSIWTICEMLGRVLKDPQDFNKIQNNCRSIIEAKLCVIKQMPRELNAAAFGICKPLSISSEIADLMSLLVEATSLEDFLIHISQNNLKDICLFIKEYDEKGTDYLNKSAELQYDKNGTTKESREWHLHIKDQEKDSCNNRILKYFASKELEKYLGPNLIGYLSNEVRDVLSDMILKIYDHSIDIALIVSAWYADKKISYRDRFAKNDDSDMFHLYYVQDDIILVTNDKMLLDNVNAEFPGRAISNDDFKKILDLV